MLLPWLEILEHTADVGMFAIMAELKACAKRRSVFVGEDAADEIVLPPVDRVPVRSRPK